VTVSGRSRSTGQRGAAVLLAGALVSLAACGGGGKEDAGGGRATLQFSGAVTGTLDDDLEVTCFLPVENGDSFQVRMDSDKGKGVGDRELTSFDFVAPDYSGPRTYDLGTDLKNRKFDGEGLFLLFKELDNAFVWGDEQGSSGMITVDSSQRSGRISLRGWENGDKMRVDVDGTFRCGDRKNKPTS
jgi:hypothetical protein